MNKVFFTAAVVICVIGALPAAAQIEDTVKRYNTAQQSVEMENGRVYLLKDTTVVERMNEGPLVGTQNIFDFENGLMVRENKKDIDSCATTVIPFSQLPSGRIKEVQSIGCLIFAKEKRLTDRDDGLSIYNQKFCANR